MSSLLSSGDIKTRLDQACDAAEQFSKLYYETFDKKRHLLPKLYLNTASLLWNGNHVTGVDKIMSFLESFPSSEHSLDSLDSQPLSELAAPEHPSVIVNAFGCVKYHDHQVKSFHQNFMLSYQGSVWKIASDTLRFLE